MASSKRILLVGVGNRLRGDDAIGPLLAAHLAQCYPEQCDELEFAGSGLDLLPLLSGYAATAIIDAIIHPEVAPGECVELDVQALATGAADISSHRVSVLDALKFARRMEHPLPAQLMFFGIGITGADHFSDQLSHQLARCFPRLAAELAAAIGLATSPQS